MKLVDFSFEFITDIDGYSVLKVIEAAGRTCYKSDDRITDDSATKFVKTLTDRGHDAMLEHYNISVRVICDRGVSHEIVRHRIASYAQESTRYCNYSKDRFGGEVTFIKPSFYVEEDLYTQHKPTCIWRVAMEDAESCYFNLLSIGLNPQDARSVLPNSLKTELVMTMNLREWRHFFKLRTAKDAHPDMRRLAEPMMYEFAKKIPVVFDDPS